MGAFHGFDELVLLGIQSLGLATCLQCTTIEIVPFLESSLGHALRRLNRMHRLSRLGDQEGTISGPQKASGLERFDFEIFAAGRALADVNECRNIWMAESECARDHGADVRSGDGLRRCVAGVPMVL